MLGVDSIWRWTFRFLAIDGMRYLTCNNMWWSLFIYAPQPAIEYGGKSMPVGSTETWQCGSQSQVDLTRVVAKVFIPTEALTRRSTSFCQMILSFTSRSSQSQPDQSSTPKSHVSWMQRTPQRPASAFHSSCYDVNHWWNRIAYTFCPPSLRKS
jgi:hypothetical protein